jgi:hypothetical protein
MTSKVAEPEKVTGIVGVTVGVGVGVKLLLEVYPLRVKLIPTELQYCPEGVGVGVTDSPEKVNPNTLQFAEVGVGVISQSK